MAKTQEKNKPSVEEQIIQETTTETEPKEENTIIETIKPSVEEQILGATDEIRVVKVVDYASKNRRYKVRNVAKNRTYDLNGLELGAILGLNSKARTDLKEGKNKTAITKIVDKKEVVLYEIEVIK